MTTSVWTPFLAASITGLVGVFGYTLTQLANRRERKSKSYAEAVAAVREYQELPYLVRRRPGSDGAARAGLAQRISEVMAKLGFYSAWLQIDSPTMAKAYADLAGRTRQLGRSHLAEAWSTSVLASDSEMIGAKAPFNWDIEPELDLCVLAMRRELSFWGLVSRGSIERSLIEQQERRAGKGPIRK